MTEFLHTASYEVQSTKEWFKERSIELMRQHNASGTIYPGYPRKRLTYTNGVTRLGEFGRLDLPNGPWHVPNERPEYVEVEMVDDFYTKGYQLDGQNRPLHPWIEELLQDDIGVVTGKGFYYEWGANQTADPVIFRHDQAEPLVLLVQRNDTGMWALPGGFVESNEDSDKAALREAQEETLIDINEYSPVVIPVYEGPVADPRTTANAWAETSAFAIHLNPHQTIGLPLGIFPGDPNEVMAAGWFTVEEAGKQLFGSHNLMVELAAKTL